MNATKIAITGLMMERILLFFIRTVHCSGEVFELLLAVLAVCLDSSVFLYW